LFSSCDNIVAEFPLDLTFGVSRMTIKSRHRMEEWPRRQVISLNALLQTSSFVSFTFFH
jgi:hypothetical protein